MDERRRRSRDGALGLYLLIRSRALAEVEREVFRSSARILEFRMWSHRLGGALLLFGGLGLAASGVRLR